VRLTVSRYFTPTGRSIQRSYEKGNKDYFDDYYDRINSGELLDAENIEVADSLKFTTPNGKVVYGGGGIIPDIFVPFDSKMLNETITFLDRKGYISNFVFEQLEKDRTSYKNFSRKEFIENFEVTDDVVTDFEDYLKLKTKSNIVFVTYKEEAKQYIKATLAEQLFRYGAYNEVLLALFAFRLLFYFFRYT